MKLCWDPISVLYCIGWPAALDCSHGSFCFVLFYCCCFKRILSLSKFGVLELYACSYTFPFHFKIGSFGETWVKLAVQHLYTNVFCCFFLTNEPFGFALRNAPFGNAEYSGLKYLLKRNMIWLHGYSDLADALFYFMFPKHGRHTHSSAASLFLKFKAHLNTCVKNVKQAKVTE